MNSYQFFKDIIKDEKYDIIFIDGLHTEEQVYKDIKNSINQLNINGSIVIHDCNPLEEIHTKSHEDFLKNGGNIWNGTVYKSFIKIKYELKDWSCFVIDEDHGCGIISKVNILSNNLYRFDISKLNWNYFESNRQKLLQLISYDAFKNIIK
jgi:hypothetical protein